MTNSNRVYDYLGHILQAIEKIQRHTADIDEVGFLNSELIQDAVVRNLEVIGEAANNILRADSEYSACHPEVPWQVMYAMRNRLSHGYDKIDFEIVWNTIQADLPTLYELVENLKTNTKDI
jgi:uncharacterized protein with HEPN domain